MLIFGGAMRKADYIKKTKRKTKSIKGTKIKMVKLTPLGIKVIDRWLGLKIRRFECPFFMTCRVCEEIFIFDKVAGECPCHTFGTMKCDQAARLLLNYNTSIIHRVKRFISKWRE